MKHVFIAILVLVSASVFAQQPLSKLLDSLNNETIPYITANDLDKLNTKTLLFDAREPQEYKVSHLKDAIHVGYEQFNLEKILNSYPDKDQEIVVYCTLGVRSEDVAESLKSAGYTKVYNLYSGIVEWKNNDLKVYNKRNKETEKVHVFDAYWSQWLKKGVKVYD